MQKASQPAKRGSPAPHGLSTGLRSFVHANFAGLRHRQVRLFALLIFGLLFLLAVLFIRPGLSNNPEVELSYTQPMTIVQASGAPAGLDELESTFLSETTGQPQADLSSAFFDFGTISREAVVQHDFLLINHGDAPLVIREARTTCGCTTANLTASIIPPGQASRITIVFNAGFHDAAGQTVRRGLLMTTNDPDYPELEIWVQARVR